MRKIVLSTLFILCSHAFALAGDIHVSATRGNDTAQGTPQAPLKTVDAALRMAREWRRTGLDDKTRGGINILLDGGTYRLCRPIFIRPEDSGTPTSPTVIRGAGPTAAVISGGVEVTGWRKAADDPRMAPRARGRLWMSDAPMQANRIVYARQMYAGGRKAMRSTQCGEYRMERMADFSTDDESITIPTPDTDLSRAGQLEMLVHQRWAVAILRVKRMADIGNGLTKVWFHEPESGLEFSHPWPQPVIGGGLGNSSFSLNNALELVDEPGEWYQDYPSGRIYYYPREGDDMASTDFIVPTLDNLVSISGTRERPVSHVRLENLAFEHAAWTRPLYEGHVTLQGGFRLIDAYKLDKPGLPHKATLENQAWIARPEAAVSVSFASGVRLSGCRFAHVGASAVDLEYAVSSSAVDSCTFNDIGGTAVMAGYFGEGGHETHIPYSPAAARDMCSGITISNNTITDAANEDWGCAAISAGYVKNTDIVQNTISNVNYSGICLGWGWTARETGMHDNHVTGNSISGYARQLYDAGGIYTLSNQPGSTISGNRISLPAKAPYATNDRAFCIYFDEATDGFTVYGNDMPERRIGYNQPGPDLKVSDE